MSDKIEKYLSVGIDVGADFSEMSIALPSFEMYGNPFKIIHRSTESLNKAVEKIKSAADKHNINVKIFMESTGVYHFALYCFLKEKGFEVYVLNPLVTHANRNYNIRKIHSDKFDSEKIAKLGLNKNLKTSDIPCDDILEIRNLLREYYSAMDMRTVYINKLKAQIRIVFPQYLQVFSKITGAASMKILEKYTLPCDILHARKSSLISLIAKASGKGAAASEKVYDKLIKAANDAAVFGHSLESNRTLIRMHIEFIKKLDEQCELLLNSIKNITEENTLSEITKQVQLLQTIPGVGFLGAVTLISEIGDFSRFKKPKQLYAYFGLDPEVKQSGNFNGTKVKISKRGSGYARKVIYLIAMQSISNNKNGVSKNSVLKDFYLEKCKTKSKMTALGAVMHKICSIVFAVLRDEKTFVLKTPQEHKLLYLKNINAA